ncbi:cache domain-containing sensor histidine kinase [Paenibacillus ihumii]|uniref:cache domain-containing sensor histidine kinase n=1 Tax=Paenibacillus ihumii TaxID=687436 RepID=UPI0006D7C1D5|nr:sensor histidine kinase [Paenibacillus ihumii]
MRNKFTSAGVRQLSFNNLPIRYKLIIHFLLISILPSIGLGFLIHWTVDRVLDRQVTNNTLQLIGKVNESLETYVENLQNMTFLIAFNPDVQRFLEPGGKPVPAPETVQEEDHYDIRKFLQGFTTLHSEVAGIMIVNSDGEYISNEMYARTPSDLRSESWYQEAVRNKGIFKIVGHPRSRSVTNHVHYKNSEVVSAVRAILDPDTQQVKGVVLIDLKLRVIAETAQDVRLGKTGYLTVIDSSGELIYAPPDPYIDHIPLEWLSQDGSGTYSHQADGRKLQFIYRVSPFTNWTTVGVFSTEDSISEMREIRFYVVSFVFVVCLLGMTASFYLAHSISRPIGQLMSFMQKAQSGDLTIRYWGDRSDEVGLLGRRFNEMLLQINRLLSLTERQERQKREAELSSLQAHIKPHFLYNTLDTIHWMARRKGAVDIAEMAESLSKLFRIGLSKGNVIIPLSDEIEHIRSYLQIQHVRYQNKLDYELKVDPAVQGLNVLKLILQPIVENAIYHGIKERRGPGWIEIEAYEQGGDLVIIIRDSGKGMTPQKLSGLRQALEQVAGSDEEPGAGSASGGNWVKPSAGEAASTAGETKGYGILNVQARLRLTFGPKYGLSLDSVLGEGTTVTIIHPLLRDHDIPNGVDR